MLRSVTGARLRRWADRKLVQISVKLHATVLWFLPQQGNPELNPHPPESVPAQCMCTCVVKVIAGKGDHILAVPSSATPKPPGEACRPLQRQQRATPHACASLGAVGAAAGGPKVKLSKASTSCDPGQVTSPHGCSHPKDGTTYLEYDGEDKRRGFIPGQPQGWEGIPRGCVEDSPAQLNQPPADPAF